MQCIPKSTSGRIPGDTLNIELIARYEALLDLANKARGHRTTEELATRIAKGWRFCANVFRWRLIAMDGSEFLVVDFDGAKISVSKMTSSALPQAEMAFWDRHVPRHLLKSDIETLELALANHLLEKDMRELIVLPLDVEERDLHALALIGSGPHGFSPPDLKFIDAVGGLFVGELSYILTTGKLTRSLEQQANQDALTGIPNRRYFETRLDLHWRNSLREHEPLSFLMIDIDNFKKFNDIYGHLVGDECLKAVATTLANVIRRPMDFCARVGGEEFGILLPNTPALGAAAVGHRLIEAIRRLAIEHTGNGDRKTVSISVGVATIIPKVDQTHVALVGAADNALYRAKENGRDRVCQTIL